MNKNDLISTVADNSGLSRSDAGKAVEGVPSVRVERVPYLTAQEYQRLGVSSLPTSFRIRHVSRNESARSTFSFRKLVVTRKWNNR